MSLNNFKPKENTTFDYVLNYEPNDFFFANFDSFDNTQCDSLLLQKPCNQNSTNEKCLNQHLCENESLAQKTINLIKNNKEAQTRQLDSSTIYDNAVQTCITLVVGLIAMYTTMYISYFSKPLKQTKTS
jgi:hypothetical protein